MNHKASNSDSTFQRLFESGRVSPGDFDHRAHIRLAYIYLVGNSTEEAYVAMRTSLGSFIAHHGIAVDKYHDTITRAWVMAVRHFMEKTPACKSAGEFIDRNPLMLNPGIMLTHYSAEVLFSSEARAKFVEPDIEAIPNYDESEQPET